MSAALDRWQTVEDYEAFRTRFRFEYESLDEKCEGLTVHDVNLGSFLE